MPTPARTASHVLVARVARSTESKSAKPLSPPADKRNQRAGQVMLDQYWFDDLAPGTWSIEAIEAATFECTVYRTIKIPPGPEGMTLDLDFTCPEAKAEP